MIKNNDRNNEVRKMLLAGKSPREIRMIYEISSDRISHISKQLGLPKHKCGRLPGSVHDKTVDRVRIITGLKSKGFSNHYIGNQIGVSRARVDQIMNPEKHRARQNLRMNVRLGNIIRTAKCDKCKTPCKPEGHHKDYSKPLSVEWLCAQCHLKCRS